MATITLTSPVGYQMFQRNGSNQANIAVTGTYSITSGTLSGGIEASLDGSTWQTIVASPSGGTFSGTLTNVSKRQGTLTVRFVNSTPSLGQVQHIGVGDIIVLYGQSNAGGFSPVYVPPQAPAAHPNWKSIEYDLQGNWREHVESASERFYDATLPGTSALYAGQGQGSLWGRLATLVMGEEDCPVAFVPCSKGSVALTGFGGLSLGGGSGEPPDTYATLFGGANIRVAAIGNDYKFAVMFQGEAESGAAGSPSTWAADFQTLTNDWQTHIHATAKWIVVAIAQASNGSNWSTVHTQQLATSSNTDVFGIADLNAGTPAYAGDIHYDTEAEINECARRIKGAMYP